MKLSRLTVLGGAVVSALLFFSGCLPDFNIRESRKISKQAQIFPDYDSATIPPNIAPLNFIVKEPGSRFLISIDGGKNSKLRIQSMSPEIVIPEKKWRSILRKNKGGDLTINIFAFDTVWKQYAPCVAHVAIEPIDRYLVYRHLKPAYHRSGHLVLRQRDLESYSVTQLLHND
ncbi:MAG: hypothetical protein GF350_10330, partial [Chitinivibrionales bacterium]|nr:hypothetical protein [Chitinivibrionales bacterium]